MLKIERRENYFRPWYVEASNTTYVLDGIKFYDVNTQTMLGGENSGWLQNSKGRDLDCLELPIDKLKRKTKIDLSSKEPFVISLGKDPYDTDNKAILYVPADMLNIKFLKKEVLYGNSIYNVFTGDYDLMFKERVDKIPTKLEELYKKIQSLQEDISPYQLSPSCICQKYVDDFLETVKELNKLSKQVEKEWNNLQILTNNFLLEQNKNI